MNTTNGGDDDDIIEIDTADSDPLAGSDMTISKVVSKSPVPISLDDEDEDEPMVLNGNSSVGDSADDSSSQEANSLLEEKSSIIISESKSLVDRTSIISKAKEEPSLVIIDTNALLAGKGPIPLKTNSSTPLSITSSRSILQGADSSTPSGMSSLRNSSTPSINIPDDAFLIEAPSFIVPYVFEQTGEKNLRELVVAIKEELIRAREAKIEAGEELTENDQIPVTKKPVSDDYFDSPTGRLLMSVGTNLVQEYVQTDLLKIQKRQAEKERIKNFGNIISQKTQQSIISLKKNLEESKENNEPFHYPIKKCELCNFKTECQLVLNTHLETPHMRNYSYRCNFCQYTTRVPQEILFHTEAEHNTKSRLERAPAYHQCPNCPFEDNSKGKLSRHLQGCQKRFRLEKNLEPPTDWDTPAKLPKLPKNRLIPPGSLNHAIMAANQLQQRQFSNINSKFMQGNKVALPPLMQAPKTKPIPGLIRTMPKGVPNSISNSQLQRGIQMTQQQLLQQAMSGQITLPPGISPQAIGGYLQKVGLSANQLGNSSNMQKGGSSQMSRNSKSGNQPSISITPLPRQSSGGGSASAAALTSAQAQAQTKQQGGKTSFVICEICDGYIKDLDQLRNHMQWIHKVKIHPKMIYNKPPLNCQKCQFRFFTDQGLERHLLGSHGLVTSSMQDAANKGQDSGRCPLCGKVYQWKLLAHVAKDHNVTLKPAHLSYKCTVCTATFGMYKLFESHVYSAHSVARNAPRGNNNNNPNERRQMGGQPPVNNNRGSQMQVTSRSMPGGGSGGGASQSQFKPLKINDEITIIPQPIANSAQTLRNKGSLTITPQSASRRSFRGPQDDEGIQIIEIDDTPKHNGRGMENGEFKARLPISDSTLRKRNLEISVCGADDSPDESFSRGLPEKRICLN
ncbi:MOG interacting and ectopic P-granules protein 1 [Orchesella cincta]|uniref:MOG interacting and ectopic P-granules protein 1 n=1 Tax=Orchesella cincta TaxID=48709 RepID=A0A1D2MMZ7_ORCCI|nr:MOG interacting and ectopic P-granules protein 1 [Orchesella cincta]